MGEVIDFPGVEVLQCGVCESLAFYIRKDGVIVCQSCSGVLPFFAYEFPEILMRMLDADTDQEH